MKILLSGQTIWLGALTTFLVIYVAYRIGKAILKVFFGLAVLALLSWWLWSFFHP